VANSSRNGDSSKLGFENTTKPTECNMEVPQKMGFEKWRFLKIRQNATWKCHKNGSRVALESTTKLSVNERFTEIARSRPE